jgi:hypothetical protein
MTLYKSKLQLNNVTVVSLGEFISIGSLSFSLSFNYFVFLCVGGFCWLAGLVWDLFF